MEIGSVVYSKAGHDAGKAYIVVEVGLPKGYVACADGEKHLVSKPKIKNTKHLRFCGECSLEAKEKIIEGTLKDFDLIYYLKKYRED